MFEIAITEGTYTLLLVLGIALSGGYATALLHEIDNTNVSVWQVVSRGALHSILVGVIMLSPCIISSLFTGYPLESLHVINITIVGGNLNV